MHRRDSILRSSLVVLACAGTTTLHAQFAAAPGIRVQASALPTGASFIGGLCRLPSSNLAVFDGARVLEVDPLTGTPIATLYQAASFAFGSFLVLAPDASALWLGESSLGTIRRIPLDGSPSQVVATVALNYDAAFDANGELFLTRGNSTWTGTEIVHLDRRDGTLDLIATVPGPSGPLVFLADGRLIYGENSPIYPAPPGSGALYSWSAAQVQSALGPSMLTIADADVFAGGLDVLSDLAVDAEGDLVVADSIYGRVLEVDPLSGVRTTLAEAPTGAGYGVTYLEFLVPGFGDPATFEPFQPEAGGRLAAIGSDFIASSEVVVLTPRRPELAVEPSSPVPQGSFTVTLEHAPPDGLGFWFLALAAQPELPSVVYGTPFFFGLAPASTFSLGTLPLSGSGEVILPAQNPGFGVTTYLQVALIEGDGTPRGTSNVLTLVLE